MMAYSRKASSSQINLYNSCPRKYYYKYKLKIKEPKTEALVKGSLVHAAIEEFYKLNPRGCSINLRNYKTEFYNYMSEVLDKVLNNEKTVFGKLEQSFIKDLEDVCENEFKVAKAVADVQEMLRNYVTVFLWQFDQYVDAKANFPQVWYMNRLKFSELELSTEDFIGYLDGFVEKDGKTIIIDFKTSKHYKLGYSEEYELQLMLYAAMYYKLHGIVPDYGCIWFIRTGIQTLYPIDKETVVERCDEIISTFLENTSSDDLEDYPMNCKGQFCTCALSKNSSKHWCFFEKMCNKEIQSGNINII